MKIFPIDLLHFTKKYDIIIYSGKTSADASAEFSSAEIGVFMNSCGVLLHITSLPGRYGCGTMGKKAFEFIDFLKESGQSCWQLLPIGPTGFGDSPYQSYSAFAGNPLFIDIDELIEDGLISSFDADLKIMENKSFSSYEELMSFKSAVLHKAYLKYTEDFEQGDFHKFCSENKAWLDDYAMYMSLKQHFAKRPWGEWEDDIRLRKPDAMEHYAKLLSSQIEFCKFEQFLFFRQWAELKGYAEKKGIKLFGDMAIYVSMDSSDIWASPHLFMLDKDMRPTKVAGCPPDDFSADGQLWGNPLYNWDAMENDDYRWWIERIRFSEKLFDIVRIDHFRGFESFYAIPAGSKNARVGEWLKGPGMKLFNAVKKELGEVSLVAENLGFLTDEVNKMLDDSGYPGMNVLEFAFWKKNESSYMPHNYIHNSVSYIGTHDNDTAMGWYGSLDKKTKKFTDRYLDIREGDSPAWAMIRSLYASVSELVIIQMQDFLELGSEARMNIPSTLGCNWHWRMNDGDLTKELAKRIKRLARTYFRTPPKKKKKKSEDKIIVSAPAEEAAENVSEDSFENELKQVLENHRKIVSVKLKKPVIVDDDDKDIFDIIEEETGADKK